jgi:hypothetical protein
MSPHTIANLIFGGGLVSLVVFVYQAIILPSIRLHYRYRIFELRDQLRRLVIEEKVKECDKAFQLLHDRLNVMCASLHRFDLVRVIQASNSLDEDGRARVANYVRVMESAPEEVQKIYRESLTVVIFALTFNSLFAFIVASVCLLVVVVLKLTFRAVKKTSLHSVKELFQAAKDLFREKVDADTTVAFFSPELATV